MQLQCNTKEFRQLKFGKIYECNEAGTQEIRKTKYEMVKVQITPHNTQRFRRDNFVEVDEQTKDLIQDNPIEEISDDF